MEIVRAFGIDTLVDDKVFAVFFWNKSIPAVGTAQFHGGEAAFIRREPGGADFAEELAFGTIVLYRKGFGALHRGQEQVSGISHSDRRLTGRIFLP